MSTRATYQFEAGKLPRITVYIHHDGYPEGAACYFWNMHHNAGHDSAYAARFLKANERAELTPSHESHGDTEYRYTLRGTLLSASKRTWRGDDDVWVGFFLGDYHEFINQYGRESFDGFEPLRRVQVNYCEGYGHRTEVLTRSQIVAKMAEAITALDSYRARFPTMVGNISSHESTVAMWRRALADYEAQGAAPQKATVTE